MAGPGCGWQAFTLLKFRTMYVGNDDRIHRQYVTELLSGDEVAGGQNNKNEMR